MNIQAVQQQELAGKRKLTAVVLYVSPARIVTRFVMLNHDSRGQAILPFDYMDHILSEVRQGTTPHLGEF